MKKSKLVSLSVLASVALMMVGCGGRQTKFKTVGLGNMAGSVTDNSFVYTDKAMIFKPLHGPGYYYFMSCPSGYDSDCQFYAAVSCSTAGFDSCIVADPADAVLDHFDNNGVDTYTLTRNNGTSLTGTNLQLMIFDDQGNKKVINGVQGDTSPNNQPSSNIPI